MKLFITAPTRKWRDSANTNICVSNKHWCVQTVQFSKPPPSGSCKPLVSSLLLSLKSCPQRRHHRTNEPHRFLLQLFKLRKTFFGADLLKKDRLSCCGHTAAAKNQKLTARNNQPTDFFINLVVGWLAANYTPTVMYNC